MLQGTLFIIFLVYMKWTNQPLSAKGTADTSKKPAQDEKISAACNARSNSSLQNAKPYKLIKLQPETK